MSDASTEGVDRRVHAVLERWDPTARVDQIRRLNGGASSLTFSARISTGDASTGDYVIKMAPPGLAPTLNRDVLRQARALQALGSTAVPVPGLLLQDAGDPPGVPPLVIMTAVPGDSIEPLTHVNSDELPPSGAVWLRGLCAARVLAYLHTADLNRIGLGNEPETALEDEIARWERAFSTVPEDIARGTQELGTRLRASLPRGVSASLVHGDYRLGNMLCEKGEVQAVIDWETWTVGDPRIDLGWLIMSCSSVLQPHTVRRDAGLPSRDDIVDAYVQAGGTAVDELDWFVALSQYRAGAMTALIVKRHRKLGEPGPPVAGWDPGMPQKFVDLASEVLADVR